MNYFFAVDNVYDVIFEKLAEDLVRNVARLLDRVDLQVVFDCEYGRDHRACVRFVEARSVDRSIPVGEKLAIEFLFRERAQFFALKIKKN